MRRYLLATLLLMVTPLLMAPTNGGCPDCRVLKPDQVIQPGPHPEPRPPDPICPVCEVKRPVRPGPSTK